MKKTTACRRNLFIFAVFLCVSLTLTAQIKHKKYPYLGEESFGVRPYEMDWAGRYEDECPALVDFEDSAEWTIATKGSVASFELSQEQPLFGKYVGKLTYRATGEDENPQVDLRLAAPRPIPAEFDLIGCWIYGNVWGWEMPPDAPWVTIHALFLLADGTEYSVGMHDGNVRWRFWFLTIHYLSEEERATLNAPGVRFIGFRVDGDTNQEESAIYFDSLTLRKEEHRPLVFQPRPKRGIEMFPGQGVGANTGAGRLPFPTREETILPDSAAPDSTSRLVSSENDAFTWRYDGMDGTLEVQYSPVSGRWDDIRMRWNDGEWIQPLFGGGVCFPADDNDVRQPERAELLSTDVKGDKVVTEWRFSCGDDSIEGTYALELRGKSLVVDTKALGGKAGGVLFGGAKGLRNPRAVLVPYYNYSSGPRPCTIVSDGAEGPLFYSAHIDWYRSNSSLPKGENKITDDGIAYSNGGTYYIPKTDGIRNDCFERFFVTVSPKFEETLPTIANPPSPWKHITGTHQWSSYTPTNRDDDKAYWRNIWRHGMRKIIVTNHETDWRDGGESFTFRTKAAPGKGGDEGLRDFSDFMQNTLGYIFGPYNNFTDFAPVNEYWDIDRVSRQSNGQLQRAWMRCYGPKPQYAVEFCEKLSPILQEKFHFSAAYCDVHTSVTPWGRCDFDYRVPGAATFASTFYAYGEIMLIQKRTWNGPVYSEGPHFCFYSGLTDGNYAQDSPNYNLPVDPWLVDFDLRKIHPLECNVGMGAFEHFYQAKMDFVKEIGMVSAVDRFLAATVAFGHPGHLFERKRVHDTLRGYFMLQQLHSRYTQAEADSIGYVDANGKILDTSEAIATDVFRRSQVVVRYKNGTCVAANGSLTEPMKCVFHGHEIDLPPNGYTGWTEDGEIFVVSALKNGTRCDYAVTPEYLFIDGRKHSFQRFPMAGGRGCGVCRKVDDTHWEFIPCDTDDIGWNLPVVNAVALDEKMNELGKTEVRHSRGLCYVVPVEHAFSYLLEVGDATAAAQELSCERDIVTPGETIVIKGTEKYTVTIPDDAEPGKRLWFEFEGKWIDFTVSNQQK
ncbi:MAG: hypothetical protein MJ106_02230 [Lentisphaeria bacterium]|nr:hypothetical protein [Lentisphaeria bacterium]